MIKVQKLNPLNLLGFKPKREMFDFTNSMVKNIDHPDREVMGLWKNESLVCIAGVNFLRPGVGEVWIIPSAFVDVYRCEFFKSIYRLINNYLLDRCGLHRVEMAIEVGWEKGVKWAEKLGFELEGIMRAYDHNYRDHYLFSKVVTHG